MPEPAKGSEPSWFGFLITIKPECKVNRTEATKILEDKGIQTRLLFSGNFIKHPCFDAIRDTDKYRVVGELANTDYIMNNSFWVGVYPGMSRAKLDYIVDQITNIFE